MKFRKILFTIILSFAINTNGISQEYKKEIENQFNRYLNSIINKDFEESMNYLTPEFFEIIPKSQMVKVMEQTFNNPSIEFEFKNPKILEVKNSEKIENKFYSLLSYSNQMNIKIKSDHEETEDEKKMRINMTKLSFEQTFGAGNIIYNDKTGFFEVQVTKQVYAISKEGQTDWKFIVVEEKQKPILEKILPKVLTDKI